MREETRCRQMGYSFRLAASVLSYAPSHRQDSTYFVTPVVEHWLERDIAQWILHVGSIRRRLLPLSYISLLQDGLQIYGNSYADHRSKDLCQHYDSKVRLTGAQNPVQIYRYKPKFTKYIYI